MRRPLVFRLLSSLLALWFAASSVAPLNDLAMRRMDDGTSGQGMVTLMAGMHAEQSDEAVAQHDAGRARATHDVAGTERAPAEQPGDSKSCPQHDCCCSALSPSALAPEATLAWIPQHVIDQHRPRCGDSVAYAEGQHRLPFANGPPVVVSA